MNNRRDFLKVGLAAGVGALFAPRFSAAAETSPANAAAASRPQPPPPKTVGDVFSPLPGGSITLSGWLGGRMDACLDRRVMAQNIGRLVAPFAQRNSENDSWESEYWGKWFTSAAFGYHYQPTPAHRSKIDDAARALRATQTPDGQITSFGPTRQLEPNWDLWGRKYALLGLIAHYDATGDEQSLHAACKAADFIVDRVENGLIIGERCVNWHGGVQSTSILAEFAMLYARTGDERYRQTAELIVKQWDEPNKINRKGLRLFTDALANKPPAEIESLKCYETLANYEGLIELYRATRDERYFQAVSLYVQNIVAHERMVHGSVSNNEKWFNGVKNQTGVLEQPVETCATAQWMLICSQLLQLTGDSRWADELELSLYNALLGVMTPDGHWWSYFAHLNGERIPCPIQHTTAQMACCVTSGPRGLLLTPQWAVMTSADGVVINLYAASTATVKLADGNEAEIVQKTSYPETGDVSLSVNPKTPAKFKLRLRIPSWSKLTKLSVNGVEQPCEPGRYAEIERVWSGGDQIQLSFDMCGRAIPAPSGAPEIAVARGPILLALDSRLAPRDDRAVYLDVAKDRTIALKPVAPPDGVWMAFEIPVTTQQGPGSPRPSSPLVLCDYASAGNRFTADNTFRTWLPQPLFLADAFPPDVWKLAYGKVRPPMPTFEEVGP